MAIGAIANSDSHGVTSAGARVSPAIVALSAKIHTEERSSVSRFAEEVALELGDRGADDQRADHRDDPDGDDPTGDHPGDRFVGPRHDRAEHARRDRDLQREQPGVEQQLVQRWAARHPDHGESTDDANGNGESDVEEHQRVERGDLGDREADRLTSVFEVEHRTLGHAERHCRRPAATRAARHATAPCRRAR